MEAKHPLGSEVYNSWKSCLGVQHTFVEFVENRSRVRIVETSWYKKGGQSNKSQQVPLMDSRVQVGADCNAGLGNCSAVEL